MADPFSVAGGVVSIVSLAITTCQGVISYYNSWETQDQRISDANEKVKNLRRSLSVLAGILSSISTSSAIVDQVNQCVLCCEGGTLKLEAFLEKCQKNPAPLTFRDKIRVCRQQAIFPFRDASLDSLKRTVEDLESNLSTALQILQLDISEAQFRQTSSLSGLAQSTASSVSVASQNLFSVEQKMDTVIGALPQMQQNLAQITSDVPIMRSSLTSIQDMARRLQAIESITCQILPMFQSRLDQLPFRIAERLAASSASTEVTPLVEEFGLKTIKSTTFSTLTGTDDNARKPQVALVQSPSVLRNICNEAGGLETNVGRSSRTATHWTTHNWHKTKKIKQGQFCSCSPSIRRRAATCNFFSIHFLESSVELSKHSMTCPFYTGTVVTTVLEVRFRSYGRLFQKSVEATLSITTGPCAFSISPCLRSRALVSKSSPAFKLLDCDVIKLFWDHQSRTGRLCGNFESVLHQLYELFQDGVASPTDISEEGETLITVILYKCICFVDASQSFRTLLKGLIAAGVPLNTEYRNRKEDDSHYPFLQGLRQISIENAGKYALIANDLAEAGADTLDWIDGRDANSLCSRAMKQEIHWLTKYEALTYDYDFSALGAAIFRRSEKDTERILRKSSQSIYEKDFRGRYPLHLSCSWPRGIILLLDHCGKEILDLADDEGFLPLLYSCELRCVEAVKLMLDADCALYPSFEHYKEKHGHNVFQQAIKTGNNEIIHLVEDALVDRRIRLYTLATSRLCLEELEELGVRNDRLLDEKVSVVYSALEQRNIAIPSALRTTKSRSTVFHINNLSPTTGESLYRRGFLDIDGVSCGITPLMHIMMYWHDEGGLKTALQGARWLTSKGADPGRSPDQSWHPHSDLISTAAHCICSGLGVALGMATADPGYSRPKMQPKVLLSRAGRTHVLQQLDEPEDECRSMMKKLLGSRIYNNCLCACSSHGCTPALAMLHTMAEWFKHIGASNPVEMPICGVDWIMHLLGQSHDAWQWLSRDIIRYKTFEGLGLTHTCCALPCDGWGCQFSCEDLYPPFPYFIGLDETEREEIQDEERLSIEKLNVLVNEFQQKYTELGVSVADFLEGYWKTRMEEVEREDVPLDDEQMARIKDLGVVIDS